VDIYKLLLTMNKWLNLIRINNWLKNLFVIAPLVFSLKIYDLTSIYNSFFAFISFCFLSSSLYIINDIIDIEKDREHPRKCNRPLTKGIISIKAGLFVALIFFITSIIISLYINTNFIIIILFYITNTLLYSIWLKNINILELILVSLNFVIRIIGGCVSISVVPSHWIIIITFFIALFLTLIKRKSEIKTIPNSYIVHRNVLKNYTIPILDKYIYISATIVVFGYILYSIDNHVITTFNTHNLIYTSIFVVIGIFRFIQLSEINTYNDEGDPTTLIIYDKFLQITILMWLLSIFAIIYLNI